MMVGIDVIEVSRVATLANKNAFIKKILTDTEREYLDHKSTNVNNAYSEYDYTLAGFWAAKEAVLKAFEIGIVANLKHVEILHKKNGAPYVQLHPTLCKKYNINDNLSISISISHDGPIAICMCSVC